ncbi:hypothetical protein [Streptococcus intermedius]|uniref:hypothetical protein n=1 Tax=Streptococcus intermedius TaxID=1338 RepID=UPI000232995C|nr:hypothetical protein [Streptococcus intermedius]EHG11699.1 hypothetical protein HMPREF9177_01581 [Streptococcus intermedius F0413]QBX25892.1 hypothetical protein Javan278_0044 [Streptococcus phage Javan278]
MDNKIMDNIIINKLSTLTLNHQIKWNTIDHLTVRGTPYSQQFQHILPDKSFFTKYEGKTFVVLYGEIRDFFRNRTIENYFLQEIQGETIEDVNVPEEDIIKLHTIISLI